MSSETYTGQMFYTFCGFWSSVLVSILMYLSAIRSLTSPINFSKFMGLRVLEGAATPWVQLYGLKTFLIALVFTFFLVKNDPGSLQWISAMATLIAIAEALLINERGFKAILLHWITLGLMGWSTYCIHLWSTSKGVI